MSFILFSFMGIMYFDYIYSVSPLPICPPPPLGLYDGVPPLTHTLPPHQSSVPLHRGIKPPKDQRPPLPLLSGKEILCYI